MSFFTKLNYRERANYDIEKPIHNGFGLLWRIIKTYNTDLILLNWLFILCCLPVFTIGPSIKAQTKVTMNLVRQEPMSFFATYFEEIKDSFFKSAGLGILYLLAIVLSLISTVFYWTNANGSIVFYFLCAISFLLLHLFSASMMLAFRLLAITNASIKQAVANSVRLIFISPKEMALIFGFVCIPIYIFLLGDIMSLTGITLFSMMLFIINSIICSYYSWQIIRKHVLR